MPHEMIRKKQQLSESETIKIFEEGSFGVLALAGDDGYPYALPISYLYSEGKLYFHCGKKGHKIDAIRNNCRASFCVVAQDVVVPEKYTTYYRSAVAFGKIKIVEDEALKRNSVEKLAVKYVPNDTEENRRKEIDESYPALCMLEMEIERMTGKEARELAEK